MWYSECVKFDYKKQQNEISANSVGPTLTNWPSVVAWLATGREFFTDWKHKIAKIRPDIFNLFKWNSCCRNEVIIFCLYSGPFGFSSMTRDTYRWHLWVIWHSHHDHNHLVDRKQRHRVIYHVSPAVDLKWGQQNYPCCHDRDRVCCDRRDMVWIVFWADQKSKNYHHCSLNCKLSYHK